MVFTHTQQLPELLTGHILVVSVLMVVFVLFSFRHNSGLEVNFLVHLQSFASKIFFH